MKGQIDGHQTHGAAAGQNSGLAAGTNVGYGQKLLIQMNVGLVAPDHAGCRLNQRASEESVAVQLDEIAVLHNVVLHHGVGGQTADVAKGVAHRFHAAQIGKHRRHDHLVTLGKLTGPLRCHLHHFRTELVTQNHRILRHIIGHSQMLGTLLDGLVCRHAHAVGNHLN